MSVEAAAVVAAVKFGCMAVGGIALVGLCCYGLYKLFETEKPHDHKDEDTGTIITTVDDLIAENNNNNNVSRQNENNQRKLDDNKIKELERRIEKLEKELEAERNSKNVSCNEKDFNFVQNEEKPTYVEKVQFWLEGYQNI